MLSAAVPYKKETVVSQVPQEDKRTPLSFTRKVCGPYYVTEGPGTPLSYNTRGPRPSWCSALIVLTLGGRGNDPSVGILLLLLIVTFQVYGNSNATHALRRYRLRTKVQQNNLYAIALHHYFISYSFFSADCVKRR